MMRDYISREAARNALYEADAITMKGVAIMNQFPAADVVEMRHGEWSRLEACDRWQCSECDVLMDIEGTPNENLLHYCPNCGAKMDGGQDDV